MVSSVPVPFIWSPFSSFFPFTHFCFSSFLSCLSLLHVLSSHPFLSFAYTSVLALGCTRTSTVHLYRFQVAQVLIMRFGLFFVPVHLVPLFIATTHTYRIDMHTSTNHRILEIFKRKWGQKRKSRSKRQGDGVACKSDLGVFVGSGPK